MSVDINWDTLTTGPDGQALADSIRDFIHDKFQQIPLPGFIQSVKVISFDLGTIAPDIEIQDICEPYPEFYEDTYAEGDEDSNGSVDEEVLTEEELLKRDRERRRKERKQGSNGNIDYDAAYEAASQQTTSLLSSMALQPPPYLDHRYPGFRPTFSPAVEQFSTAGHGLTPGLTPGLRGPASNLHYFHSALSSGFSGALTPLASLQQASEGHAYGWSNHFNSHHNHTLNSPQLSRPTPSTDSPSQSPPSTADSSLRTPGAHSLSGLSRLDLDSGHSDGTREPPSTPFSEHPPHITTPAIEQDEPLRLKLREPRDTDTQIVARVRYAGDIRISMTAALLIDYPAPNFVSLPVRLTLTGMTFDGTAIIAHIRNRAHFCFVDDGEGGQGKGCGVGGMLREIKIESEIGEKGKGKQVLKNVGKIEMFVLERVRRILEEEFVFPSSWTFLL